MAQRVLVVDVGGTHLKILATGQQTPRKARLGANDIAFIGGFRLWSAKKDTGSSIFDG